ncbi:Protein transport protein sec9 [Colletotrichum aenigma]|uniref:Protein transport protein sec9 n=1 Tax=Colletotrichum aenigma TaxID=1215731 RepID=UPI001872FC20|nr:Protein transport protein sec9 [Colletotrichum aenigma]KAF5528071.1 Protein transport protein sec9 [Colletotrichum aenigma]
MKKFGFGKKSGGDDGDDASRSALFGSKKNKSPAPGSDNPYAQAPAGNDPYAQDNNKYANMTPYQAARAGNTAPGGVPGGLPSGPRAGGGYGAPPQPAGGYANEKYGAAGGYGGNRYDNANQNAYGGAAGGARGPGGYGGLGRTNSNDTDAQRDELFGGAQDRYQQKQQQPGGYGQSGGYGDDGASGAGGGYGGYGESRELTAEEQEAEEYRATKNQITETRQESVNTVNRALQAALQAEETGRSTLARLGAQGERLHNTERNLDLAANHNKVAEDRAKELKTLNRSMFAVHVSNPFTSKSRAAARDQAVLDRHRQERDTREQTRNAAFQSNQRMEEAFKEVSLSGRPQGNTRSSAAERSKYVLDDSDDEGNDLARRQEDEIDDGLGQLEGAMGRLNGLARAQLREVETQNTLISKISEKARAFRSFILYYDYVVNTFYRAMLWTTQPE